METLTLNGKEYVKASRAARDLGYATDYVGQLCRSGSVDAHLVGRTWYVNPETLGAHRLEKKRNSRIKAREYARKSIEASRTLNVGNSTNSYKNIAIRYESDTDAVIPEVKKVHIVTEKFVMHQPVEETSTETYEVLNKNKKILMSGSIPVYDAEEETVLTDTVTLSPKIVRHAKKTVESRDSRKEAIETVVAPQEEVAGEVMQTTEAPSFVEKLVKAEVQIDTDSDILDTATTETDVPTPRKSLSVILGLLFLYAIVIVGVAGLFFESQTVYTSGIATESFAPTTDIILDFMLKYKDISSVLD